MTARLRVETKTDFPLRGATKAAEADRESPAVSRLRRSAAVAAAAALAEDAPDDGGGVEDIFLKTLMMCLKQASILSERS